MLIPSAKTSARAASPLVAAALALALPACAPDRAATGSVYPYEVTARHPIVLTDAPRTLDLFTSASVGLDQRQRTDVKLFAEEYRKHGQGPLHAQVPADPRGGHAAQHLLADVRAVAAASGVAGGHLRVSTYHPADPSVASPTRLSFQRLQAKVAGQCGQWPQDLGASDVGFNLRNEPYWNYGCAMQTNVAAQLDDPVDLVRGRAASPADTIRRTRDIENLRQGKDPSTQYKQDGEGKISTIGN